jgi:hypothetical protein
LKPRETERRESGWVILDTTFTNGWIAKFTAIKVPRQRPLVLLVKMGWREGKTFGCEEGRDETWRREGS